MVDPRIQEAVELMTRFAARTGLTNDCPPRRYLWTDAFAVCNFLGLARVTGDGSYGELALRLVEQVHRVLGRHRADDTRRGWLSGLGEHEWEAHPTRGGLRIGKRLPERGPAEPMDEQREWDRDGQYFHYLTKWMHALDQVARATGQALFNVWARELAATAHRAFTHPAPGGGRRMYWKASIDLSRPQVASMGQHDPLDGLVTCRQLEATAAVLGSPDAGPHLADAAADFATMLAAAHLATADPLGIGGLLIDAYRVAQLIDEGTMHDDGLLEALLAGALAGLRHYAEQPDLRAGAEQRLGFRELGLAIGLAAVDRMRPGSPLLPPNVCARREEYAPYLPLRAMIEAFWRRPEHRRARTWLDHEDINDVMLATSLLPEGFLVRTST